MPAVNQRRVRGGVRYFVRFRMDGRQTCATFDTYEEAAAAARQLEEAAATRRTQAGAHRVHRAVTRSRPPRIPATRRLPAAPLLRLVDQRGATPPDDALARALTRARREGTVTPYSGDHLAVRLLGLTAWEVWGDQYASG